MSDHLIALGAIAVVTVLLQLASPVANTTTVALCLLLVVLFVARSLTRSAAVSASIAGVLVFNFFFLPPIGTFTIADPLNWVALLAFLAVALTVSQLSARARRQTAEAQAHAAEAATLSPYGAVGWLPFGPGRLIFTNSLDLFSPVLRARPHHGFMVIGIRRFTAAFIAALITLIIATAAAAQPAEPQVPTTPPPAETLDWTYGGLVDVAYLHSFNDPPNKLFRSRGTAWHLNDPYLNMTAAYVKKKASEQSPWGMELNVQTGKDDEIFGFSATAPNMAGSDVLRHLGLANVSYVAPVGKGLTLQGGIFGSLIGYDGLYAKDNLNYTRPWGADFTPYLMLGANASYPLTDKLTGTLYLVNGYWHLANANSVPSTGLQLAYKATPAVTVKESVMWGPHQSNTGLEFWRFIADTIVERKTERATLGFNGHFATERVDDSGDTRAWWVSVQAAMRWNIQGPWSLAVRPEFAWDSTGRWTLAEQAVKAITTTLEYRVPYRWSNTLLRAEYRYDDSRGPQGGFFAEDNSLKPGQPLFIVAAIFTFDSPSQR